MFQCRSTFQALKSEGFSSKAKTGLRGGRGKFPHRLSFKRSDIQITRAQAAGRMSISGVQDKIQLELVKNELQMIEASGQFLLKPIPSTPLLHVEDVPANEHLCMQIAAQVFGIETPPNALVLLADDEPAYLVRRYDRGANSPDGKLHQEDFAQALARSTESPTWKYEGSYEDMAQAIRLSCPAAVVNLERLWHRIVLCYALSNGDAHWKNFSVLEDQAGGFKLSPAYDLVATSIHFPNKSSLALDLFSGGETSTSFEERGFWIGKDFLELARRWDLPPDRSKKWLAKFISKGNLAVDLAKRSFLSEPIRQEFVKRWLDRIRALSTIG